MKIKNSNLVYSTDFGKLCPKCSKPVKQCKCSKKQSAPIKNDGVVRVSRETKGRKGKGMTLISGVPFSGQQLKDYAKQLKQKCGTGGTVKEGIIEIQGDHRDTLIDELKKQGWIVKRSGG